MTPLWILSFLLAARATPVPKPASHQLHAESVPALIQTIAASGRCVSLAERPSAFPRNLKLRRVYLRS